MWIFLATNLPTPLDTKTNIEWDILGAILLKLWPPCRHGISDLALFKSMFRPTLLLLRGFPQKCEITKFSRFHGALINVVRNKGCVESKLSAVAIIIKTKNIFITNVAIITEAPILYCENLWETGTQARVDWTELVSLGVNVFSSYHNESQGLPLSSLPITGSSYACCCCPSLIASHPTLFICVAKGQHRQLA